MDSHPNVGHWDDVEPFVIDRGELRGERRRLGPAVGCAGIGCSRYVQAPGERAMPVHQHADEEELFFVLGGSGFSWQDGRVHAVGKGDAMLHLAGAEAHTLVAGDEGIDVLAFGSGSATNMTWLPRARAWWMGPRWLPSDGPSPFALEAAAGPLELPGASPRPATVVNLDAVALEQETRGRYGWSVRDLGNAAGAVRAGLKHDRLEPGQWTCPPHWHSAEEELFLVLDGTGEVELGTVRHPLRPGSVVARPPGSGEEHALVGGPEGMTYLAYGTRVASDVCFYPRTHKVNFGRGMIFRLQPVDYWDGE